MIGGTDPVQRYSACQGQRRDCWRADDDRVRPFVGNAQGVERMIVMSMGREHSPQGWCFGTQAVEDRILTRPDGQGQGVDQARSGEEAVGQDTIMAVVEHQGAHTVKGGRQGVAANWGDWTGRTSTARTAATDLYRRSRARRCREDAGSEDGSDGQTHRQIPGGEEKLGSQVTGGGVVANRPGRLVTPTSASIRRSTG